jgi:Zn-dependent protease
VHELLLALPVLLFSMVAHEYAHGFAALRQGDPTALNLGRLTLNPLKHIDPVLTILMPALLLVMSGGRVVFGGAKPVPVNPRNYKNYRRGDIIVSSAGVLANLGLASTCLALAVGFGVLGSVVDAPFIAVLQEMVAWGIWLNLLLVVLNLVPIPPLDGSHLLYHALPPALGKRYRELGRYGLAALMLLIFIAPGALYTLLTPAFVLQRVACAVVEPWALGPIQVCGL